MATTSLSCQRVFEFIKNGFDVILSMSKVIIVNTKGTAIDK